SRIHSSARMAPPPRRHRRSRSGKAWHTPQHRGVQRGSARHRRVGRSRMSILNGVEHLPEHTTVAIAGGGPAGTYLALALAAHGVASTVIEPRVEVDHHRPSAKTTNARTMTLLADRKSTRLNSSHVSISYAVFCLKKKKDMKV